MISAVFAPRSTKAFLPAFTALSAAGFAANAPLLAVLLLRGYAWMGLSLFSGYALGMLIYGFLYGVVNHGFALPTKAERRKRPLPAFGLLLVGKLLVFGGAVAFLLCVLHVAALWMLAGVLLTQIGVTAHIMRWLTNNKGTE